MRSIEKLLSDLMRDSTGIDARRIVHRIGGKRLLMMGGLVAAGALLNQKKASTAGAAPEAPPTGATPRYTGEAAASPRPPAAAGPDTESPQARRPTTGPVFPTLSEADTMDAQPTPDAVSAALDRANGADLPPELSYAAIRVMVAAALADGHLVAQERSAVERHLEDAELTAEQEAQVRRDLVLPATAEELAALTTEPAGREVLYQLAYVVLHADGDLARTEVAWLERLGRAFALSAERRDALEEEVRATLGE